MIHVQAISKDYVPLNQKGVVHALSDVSFSIQSGEFVSIVGPSGCGKSTLLNIIAGFLPATSGEVLFDGEIVRGSSPQRIVVFQEHNLFPWKTVMENVMFGLKAQGASPSDQRRQAQKWIELVHLHGFEQCYPYELSGGMRQRVALARALAVEPNCILMDEPLGSLDAYIREKLQVEIMSLWRETKKTIIMVTHDIDEALFLSERIIVMDKSPGTINEIVSVNLDVPRHRRIKSDPKFLQLREKLYSCIMM